MNEKKKKEIFVRFFNIKYKFEFSKKVINLSITLFTGPSVHGHLTNILTRTTTHR
jgi:hypothetical protein